MASEMTVSAPAYEAADLAHTTEDDARAVPSLSRVCLAEFLGTYLLVLLGCGAVHADVLTRAHGGLWQVAVVWGVAIMIAVYTVGGISGAHINPAVTLALAAWRRFPWGRTLPYVAAQLIGAFVAAATLFILFGPHLAAKEHQKQVVRGGPGSEVTAMCYGEYFPSPGPLAASSEPFSSEAQQQLSRMVPRSAAFLAEALGTLVLALVVFAVTDPRNSAGPSARLAPVFIGLTVAALISVIAPLTQACFNPARDLGPRLFAYLAGWGAVAWPGPNGLAFLAVYALAPVLGALVGAGLYTLLLQSSQTQS